MKSRRSKGLACASILVAGTMLLPTGEARAQTVFTTIQAFGDSYADIGNAFRLAGVPNPPQYPTGRFSGGTNFIDTTSALLGIPQVNFAVGGATSGTTNVGSPFLPGFTQEWQGFIASGRTFAPSDLLEMSVGGNDARAYRIAGGTLAGVPAAATVSFNQTMAGINALVGVGVRNLVFTTGDVGQLPEAVGNPNAAIGTAYSQFYNAQMQIALAAIASSGVRVELVDIAAVGNLIKANPALYGISNTGACPLACIGNPALQNQFLFYFDGVHLTSHGFAILGEYIVNRLNAPLTFAPQGDLAIISATGFASTLYGKLDMFRETYGLMPSTMNAYAAYAKAPYLKAPPPLLVNPWSFYMQANGGISDRQATVASNGFNLDGVGGTIGTEYRINSNAFVGAAFDYSNPKARLFNSAGTRPGKGERLHRIRRSRADLDGRPADRRGAGRKRRRAIPRPVHCQRPGDQPLSQFDGGGRFDRKRSHHPVRRDIRAADHQQLVDPERYLATCLRPRSGRRCGASDEQRGADDESFANAGPSGRRRFLRYRRPEDFVLRRIVWRMGFVRAT